MNVNILKNGSSIKSHVVSYERQKRICTGVGILQLIVKRDYSGGFDTWDIIKIYEGGNLRGTYFVSQIDDEEPSSTITIYAQDASKYLVDYFIDEVFTIDYPSYNKEWIIKFLNDAGITDIEFNTDDPGTYLSNNTTLGLTSAYDQLMYLVQISGWYFHFDANNTCIIGKLDTDLANPRASLSSSNIIEIRKISHDKMFRNRIVVWGQGSGYLGQAVGVEAYKITPWNYDSNDLRTIVIANSNIPSSGIAQTIANNALDYFDEITVEKHITAVGAVRLDVGDACRVSSRIWRGKGLVTTFGTSMSKEGLISNIILDEKCPRLFAYFDFGDYVYIGTVESGVWRKHIKYGISGWYNFNGGDLTGSGTGITDLFIRGDIGTTVTFSGGAYWTYVESDPVQWNGVVLDGAEGTDDNDTPVILSDPNIKARACTIDRSNLDRRFLLDTWSGRNYKNFLDMYYNRFSSPYLFSGQIYSGVAPLGLFAFSGYAPFGSGYSSWVMGINADEDIKIYPITFSGLVVGSGGYSVVGFDMENDGVYDYVSVHVDRPPIFYINTEYDGQNYITGINAYTRQLITHIHSSGIIVDSSSPESVWCHNVGNMMASTKVSGKVVLLNNHTVNNTIPVTASGEYDFGVGIKGKTTYTAVQTRLQSYNNDDYVSFMSVPSGVFLDQIVESSANNALVDKIGDHHTVRYSDSGTGYLIINNYNFTISGWSFIDTDSIPIPAIGTGPYSVLSAPVNDYIYTGGGGVYGYLAYKQNGISPIMYDWYWVTVYESGYVDLLKLTAEEVNFTPPVDFVNDGRYYLDFGGGGTDPYGTTQGYPVDPRYLIVIDASGGDNELVTIFDGLPASFITFAADGIAWYRLRVFPYQNTYQVIGFAFIYRVVLATGERGIYVYPISGLSGKASIGDLLYVEDDVDITDPQSLFDYTMFSRKWSLAYYEAKESNPVFGENGNTKASILNYGPHGAYVQIPPLTQWLGGSDYTDFPWRRGSYNLPTPIADPLFDDISVMVHNTDGLFISRPPFTDRGTALDLNGHVPGSRPYMKPESSEVKSFMVLQRDGNDYNIVTGGGLPYRLDCSHPSPLVTANIFRFSFETFYISKEETSQISQLHPLSGIFASGVVLSSGVGFDLITDYRYTSMDSLSQSGYGQMLFYTTSGGLCMTPFGNYSLFTLYSGYTDAVASGVILGSASMIETSNFAYPEQYLFLSTIVGANDFRFYQKNPSGIFEDCTYYSGWPNSEVTIIRLEDLV